MHRKITTEVRRCVTLRQRSARLVAALTVCGVIAGYPAVAKQTPEPTADQGSAALQSGNPRAAIAQFSDALKDTSLTNDRRAALLNDRGVAHMRLGQSKRAIEDFNAAVQLLPEYAAIYNNRGNLLLSLGLLKEAKKDFDRALVLAPGYAAAYNNRAGVLARRGDYHQSVADYTQAVKLAPTNPAPLSGRGRVYLNLDRPHAAMRDFTRAVTANARFAVGYRDRAQALMQLEDYEGAIEDLSRAIAFDVNNPAIYLIRGKAYLSTDNTQSALTDFSRAIELNPNYAEAYEMRGLTHAWAGAQELAFQDINTALQLNPRSSVAFAYRAFAYKQSGQAEVGRQDIENARELDSERAEVYWAKAEIEEAMGNTDQAIADLRKALRLEPGMRYATAALQRLGLGVEPERPVGRATPDGWQVYLQNSNFFARNPAYPRLTVPLERWGAVNPKVMSWQVRDEPFRGIGVLRYQSGLEKQGGKKTPIVHAAIVDLYYNRVVAIELDQRGKERSTWTWGNGQLTVANLDGATDVFDLRQGRARAVAGGGGGRSYRGPNGEYWSPWAEDGLPKPRPRTVRKRKKPKTLFDLLFN